jgi:N-acetylneuraminic acid mutarotase
MENCVIKCGRWMIGELRFCALLFSISLFVGCGGSSGTVSTGGTGSSGGSGGSGGSGSSAFTYGTWTWEDGSNTNDQLGTYGFLGTPASANVPGARIASAGWVDTTGNFWLFGGAGELSVSLSTGWGYLNDLWRYSPSSGEWIWMSGSSTADNQKGIYGLGTAAPGNLPGSRDSAATWTDKSGNFWLFGGQGYDSAGDEGYLNDLWEFSPTTGYWEWVTGSNYEGQAAAYGTEGKAAAGNSPGPRSAAVVWTDAQGNFWLFGGYGDDSTGKGGPLNDLWKFSPSTSQWEWNSGSDIVRQNGTYGTEGTAAVANVPGGRSAAMGWIDSSGNLWVFGGNGCDSIGTGQCDEEQLNDLWKYNPSSGQWTWVSGSNIANATGTYGAEGTAAAGNVPGARTGGSTWTDSSGNLWLFGGLAVGSTLGNEDYNDLWKYSPSASQWTWMGGTDAGGSNGAAAAIYGSEGTAAATNIPGGRDGSQTWIDSSGNVWIFGGYQTDFSVSGDWARLNDLWKFTP